MKNSRRILGLDLGTNSIGWAIVDQEGEEFSLSDQGVRIFSEGVASEKGIESSRAAERTGFRSARKIKFRRKLRKYETLKVLAQNDMCPLTIKEVEDYRKSGFKHYPSNADFINWLRTDEEENKNPYAFRDKASRDKTNPMEVGRALYHIAQRRGFLSNRLDQSDEGVLEENSPLVLSLIEDLENVLDVKESINNYFEEKGIFDVSQKTGYIKDQDEGDKVLIKLYKSLYAILSKGDESFEKTKEELIAKLSQKENLGVVKGAIHDLSAEMKEKGFETLGQLFYDRYSKTKIRKSYTSREEHYLTEFELICKIQGFDKIFETEKLPDKRFVGLAKDLYRAIFYQRPLKSQKGSIGKCSFEPARSRCAISHPDFEEFRMWNYLNTIKMAVNGDKLQFLSQEQKESIIPKFLRKKESFNFEDLAKELIPNKKSFGFYKSSKKANFAYWFNYNSYDSVAGCPVSASLKSVFGENWKSDEFRYKTLDSNGVSVDRSVDCHDLWHLLSTSSSDDYLIDFATSKLKLDAKQAKAFSKIRLKKDYASLSLNAIRKILPYTRNGLLYSHAVFMANLEKIVDKDLWNNPESRLEIQNIIGQLIENHTLENSKLEIINGMVKNLIEDGGSFSVEAEPIFKKELKEKLIGLRKRFKLENELTDLEEQLYPALKKQLTALKFEKIKRIDDKVKEFLLGENADGQVFCSDENRFSRMYHPSDIDKFQLKEVLDENKIRVRYELGSPLSTSIKNPMAMRAIHQLRKVLNTLIAEGKIDEHTHLHIEMSRELNDANKRKGIQDYQNEIQKERAKYIDEIKKLYLEETKKKVEPTEDDILRYQLWIEQNKQEIYEPSINGGKANSISISQIIGANPDYDIEHTVPRSRSQDNSQTNKTLCSKRFNRDIKKNLMPSELDNHALILPFVEHWKKEADSIKQEIGQLSKRIKGATTKEAKDKSIRKRHYLNLKKNYLKEKYDNFVRLEPKVGFKNSQIPDTGIITRYAQAYLKSYFKRVVSVKGGMVAEFRKQWGIQKSFIDENGQKQYNKKDRSKHTHHTIDAITIACMTKEKYDILASAWTLEDREDKKAAKALIEKAKPWKTFAEDLAKIEENILVSHYTPDNLKIQSKKIMRIRGKKQFVAEMEQDATGKLKPKTNANGKVVFKLNEKGEKIPRFHQGDTVRGSLHKDTIYGRVLDPESKEIRSVIRKSLESIKASDVDKIVDPEIKEKVRQAILEKVLKFSSSDQQANKIDKEIGIWMNKEKGVAIHKVRIYADTVKNPLEIKKHVEFSKSRHPHKQHVYGQNDGNYCMAIYEGKDKKGKIYRTTELVNNISAGDYFKTSFKNENNLPIVPETDSNGNLIKYLLTKGKMILMYNKHPEELFSMDVPMLYSRLYEITQLDVEDSCIKLLHHSEAREKKEITTFMGLKSGMKGGKNLDDHKNFPWIKIAPNSFDCLVEGIDFTISTSGKINFLI
jgi:CRISPR-associated endonuclease Csn1